VVFVYSDGFIPFIHTYISLLHRLAMRKHGHG
jgi:hypothetical protein